MRTWTTIVLLTQVATPTPSQPPAEGATFTPLTVAIIAGICAVVGAALGARAQIAVAKINRKKSEKELFDENRELRAKQHRVKLGELEGKSEHIDYLKDRVAELQDHVKYYVEELERLQTENRNLRELVDDLEQRALPTFDTQKFRPGNGGRGGSSGGPPPS